MSLFGNTSGGGGLFGNTTPGGGGLFGTSGTTNTASGGGLFGNTGNTTGTTGGGLFGNTSTTTSGTTGGLFGGNTASTGGGGLFGSTSNTTGNTGGGLFGNTGATGNTAGGLFGNTGATGNTGGGLFSNTGATGNTGGGLFGNSGAAGNTGGGLFGNTGTTGNTGGGLFGTTGNTGGGLFGNKSNATSGLFSGGNAQTGSMQQPMIGRQKDGEPPLVTLTTRPTVRDIARLHPETAMLIQDLYEWFKANEEALEEIKTEFSGVESLYVGAWAASAYKESDAHELLYKAARAEDLLEAVRPSIMRMAETTDCLMNDFARLDAGVVTVPPVEHVKLLDEFWEKKELLERHVNQIEKDVETFEELNVCDFEVT
eukprot:Blabericola_migrator_1__91@NODE_1021_length_5671_cov_172_069950_g701_i0_p3_GENE_NODE_1021_length_5671_cov_172_069950_g701_i0NODE_1021_length_5671_cov_172_069950_g701_i0_p3_ORF_typecomplete_len370_score86_11Nucleoporin_FG/PF13634_6/5_8e08Nucleoporin_FG/PF13634_6/1_5e06Nucleoporin_FG/PF13634_6/8_1e08_NODE_1021_length_5671_cov_172_069950_g701_i02471356